MVYSIPPNPIIDVACNSNAHSWQLSILSRFPRVARVAEAGGDREASAGCRAPYVTDQWYLKVPPLEMPSVVR